MIFLPNLHNFCPKLHKKATFNNQTWLSNSPNLCLKESFELLKKDLLTVIRSRQTYFAKETQAIESYLA